MFDSLCIKLHYINGFVENGCLNFYKILFSALDKDDNPQYIYPYKCRGMMITCFYSPEIIRNIYWGNPDKCGGLQVRPDFIPCYDKLNFILAIHDSYYHDTQKNINWLNSIKQKFKIPPGPETDLKITKHSNSRHPEWTYYKLTGSVVWQSSAPILSFCFGVLKFSQEWSRFGKVYIRNQIDYFDPNVFITKYATSSYCTDNVNLIIKEWSTNYDKINGNGYSHNYGAGFFAGYDNYV